MHFSVCYFDGAQRGHRSPLVYTNYLCVIVFSLLCVRACCMRMSMCVCVYSHKFMDTGLDFVNGAQARLEDT
jgi:hypothetical protein